MKNYLKLMVGVILVFFLGIVLFAFISLKKNTGTSDEGSKILALNGITKSAEENWQKLNSSESDSDNLSFDCFFSEYKKSWKTEYDGDLIVLNESGDILYDSQVGSESKVENPTVEYAIKMNYPYRYIVYDNRIVGTVILIDNGMSRVESARLKLFIALGICGFVLLILMIIFYIYVEKNIIIPFERMKDFAGKVAEGRLDEPLSMDKENIFGAFTESFDIMRVELAESKKRELSLQKKERELVASLSHDLKTPITGIKLTTELLQAKLGIIGDKEACTSFDVRDISGKLENIGKKAEQMDILVNDLFTSTLDDLGEFRVNIQDEDSKVIGDIIKKYDDRNFVKSDEIPAVIINIDVRRLSQVIGNIISNSYKYAGTEIEISYKVTEEYLRMKIRDYGPGVPESEIDLITNKFYRGKAWKNSKEEGSGLGLYIAKTLMEKMNGELITESNGEGLEITLLIPLS